MFLLSISIDYSAGLPLIVAAGLSMYIASKALADAWGGSAPTAGRLAVGQWLPIAILAIAAVVTHRRPLAIGVVFSTSIACLSLATGAVCFLGLPSMPAGARKSWAMLLPAALLAFLAGFRASISLFNAAAIALQGVCILLLWNDRTDPAPGPKPKPAAGRGMLFRAAQTLIGLMLAAVGSWFAMHGIDRVAEGTEFASTGLLTTTLLSPLLVLPIIGSGTELAQHDDAALAVASQVGVSLLNICALLPILVLVSAVQQMLALQSWSTDGLTGFPFPLAVWRVDVVILIALGLFMIPVAIGKWSISKTQGAGLMLGYVIYLGLSILISVLRV
jgi:hypothetical protein